MSSNRTRYSPQVGLAGPITPGVKGLLIANVGIFAIQVLAQRIGGLSLEGILGLTPEGVMESHFLWQLVTYMFLHSTGWLGHLLLNMLMLWMFGTEIEKVWGTREFLRYYFICGIGAGITTCLFNYAWYPTIPTIGASGAIFGVMLAYGFVFPNRQIFFWFIFPMRATSFVLLCACIEMFSLLGISDGVAHFAHLGGMLFGYLYLKRVWRLREFWNELRWRLRRRRFRVMRGDDEHYPYH
jgi:membrane associated rhomboid family serine protease